MDSPASFDVRVLCGGSDEIYANSVFGDVLFESAAQLVAAAPAATQAAAADLCHVVFGLSKDWCGSHRRTHMLQALLV